MRASGDRRTGVREEEAERDDARPHPEERSHPQAGATEQDEQGARAPDGEVDRMRHELGRLPGEAGSREIAGQEPRDPADDTDGEQRRRDDGASTRAGDWGSALADRDDRAWRLKPREPGPRAVPALAGLRPPLD